MKSLHEHLEDSQAALRGLTKDPVNPVFLFGASVNLASARFIALRWAGILSERDTNLRQFLVTDIKGPQESDDPVKGLWGILVEVAALRSKQVMELRGMLHQ